MIDIVTNNVKQIGTPADEGRVYISEKAYKRIKTEGFKDKEVFVLMGHTESSGGRYATFVERRLQYMIWSLIKMRLFGPTRYGAECLRR